MIICGHQPNFLPYPGFFHKIALSDIFVMVDNVQFVKRGPFGWQHRNRIRTGKTTQWLTVPVKTKGRFHQKIHEVEIDNQLSWGRKHWRSIKHAYGQKPFFKLHSGFFEEICHRPWGKLSDLNIAIIQHCIQILNLNMGIRLASELNITGQGTQLIVALCRAFKAKDYLSGLHGRDYLDMALLKQSGIRIHFQEYVQPVYTQHGHSDFIPDLAILDLLFNCGPESAQMIRNAGKMS